MGNPNSHRSRDAAQMVYDGASFADAGRAYGISRQAVEQAAKAARIRRYGKIFDNIPYKCLREIFRRDPTLSMPEFTREVYGFISTRARGRCERLLKGEEIKLTIAEIQRLVSWSGMSFEELFEPVEGE